jgi:hypothetical protein
LAGRTPNKRICIYQAEEELVKQPIRPAMQEQPLLGNVNGDQ